MNNKDQIVLRKIQGHIESILRYCEGIQSFQEFQSNSMRVEATVFTIILEGEHMKRCRWADPNSELYIAYHDREWGRLEHDDQKLFEMLILEGFQAGLSWLTILKKREAFRRAFDRFDPAAVAQYGPEKVESLMADVGIVRNRRKILASIQNAKIFLAIQEEFGSFDRYLWSFTEGEVIVNTDDVFHTHTDLSDRISKDLKRRGMSFVGTTIIYSFLQAVGVVNDHELTCFCHPRNQ